MVIAVNGSLTVSVRVVRRVRVLVVRVVMVMHRVVGRVRVPVVRVGMIAVPAGMTAGRVARIAKRSSNAH
jgi:hypothetical protein